MWGCLSAREQRSSGVDLMSVKHAKRVETIHRMSEHRSFSSHHTQSVQCMDCDTIEKRYVLTAAIDNTLSIYDRKNTGLEPLARYRRYRETGGGFRCAKWYTADTGLFVTTSNGPCIDIWDTNRMETVASVLCAASVTEIALSPLGHHTLIAAACRDKRIHLCDIRTQNASHELRGHHDAVQSVAWSPIEEHVFASGSTDRTVQIWDIRRPTSTLLCDMNNQAQTMNRRKRRAVFQHDQSSHRFQSHADSVTYVRYTCDGLRVLSYAMDKTIHIWDAYTGDREFQEIRNDRSYVGSRFAIDTDGLLFVPQNRKVVVFDLDSGESITTLGGHFGHVTCTAIMDDGALWTADTVGRITEWT